MKKIGDLSTLMKLGFIPFPVAQRIGELGCWIQDAGCKMTDVRFVGVAKGALHISCIRAK